VRMKFGRGWTCALLIAGLGTAVAQTDPMGKAIDVTVESNRAARASQDKIDKLDDQTRTMLDRYRSASWQAQQLTVYANQLGELVSAQDAEKASLNRQIDEMERTERELLPLMLRMVEGLEKFIALDLPFLATERRERLESVKKLMGIRARTTRTSSSACSKPGNWKPSTAARWAPSGWKSRTAPSTCCALGAPRCST